MAIPTPAQMAGYLVVGVLAFEAVRHVTGIPVPSILASITNFGNQRHYYQNNDRNPRKNVPANANANPQLSGCNVPSEAPEWAVPVNIQGQQCPKYIWKGRPVEASQLIQEYCAKLAKERGPKCGRT